MVISDAVEHLSRVEALDTRLFQEAMTDAGVEAAEAAARGLSGADRLPDLVRRLNR